MSFLLKMVSSRNNLLSVIQTGFEFKKRKAYPVVEGIVIAAENEAVLLEVRVHILNLIEIWVHLHVIYVCISVGILGGRTGCRGKG